MKLMASVSGLKALAKVIANRNDCPRRITKKGSFSRVIRSNRSVWWNFPFSDMHSSTLTMEATSSPERKHNSHVLIINMEQLK